MLSFSVRIGKRPGSECPTIDWRWRRRRQRYHFQRTSHDGPQYAKNRQAGLHGDRRRAQGPRRRGQRVPYAGHRCAQHRHAALRTLSAGASLVSSRRRRAQVHRRTGSHAGAVFLLQFADCRRHVADALAGVSDVSGAEPVVRAWQSEGDYIENVLYDNLQQSSQHGVDCVSGVYTSCDIIPHTGRPMSAQSTYPVPLLDNNIPLCHTIPSTANRFLHSQVSSHFTNLSARVHASRKNAQTLALFAVCVVKGLALSTIVSGIQMYTHTQTQTNTSAHEKRVGG